MFAANDEAHDPVQLQRDRKLVRTILRKADEARGDRVRFFDFVMREERTQKRIQAAPHQRLFFEFVSAHATSVVRMPVGFSKTFCSAALVLQDLGRDPTSRWAFISAAQAQAAKPFSMVQDYIEGATTSYPELGLTFPQLQPSLRRKDPWTQTKLVVDRPPGIRDPSLLAVGVGGKLPGARLAGCIVDDILDMVNTATPAGRTAVHQWFDKTVLSRRDAAKAWIVVTNTPWHTDDITYRLERAGWPTLTMSIDGDITITNADYCPANECSWTGDIPPDGSCPLCGEKVVEWDSAEIRPALGSSDKKRYRLAAHDAEAYGAPLVRRDLRTNRRTRAEDERSIRGTALEHYDLDETIPLWPEQYSLRKIAKLRWDYRSNMVAFNQLYRCICRDDETAKCKVAWIDQCKQLAQAAGVHYLVSDYRGPNLVVTGVDLAIGQGEEHDYSALFTFEVIPKLELELPAGDGSANLVRRGVRNLRRILDIDFGRWQGRTVIDKVIDKVRRYGSIVRVETNAAQDYLRQWTLDVDISVPVRAHHTGANKMHRVMGVEGLFIELENGAWLIPTDTDGAVAPAVQQWIDECLNYRPPPAHTGDVLMASWLARAQARELDAGEPETQGDGLSAVMAR